MPKLYELADLKPILIGERVKNKKPFTLQATLSSGGIMYLADHRGIWLHVPDNEEDIIEEDEFQGITGFKIEELMCKKEGDIFIYALKNGEPLLPFPFTSAQLMELEQRTGGFFSERINYQFGEADEQGAKETAALIEEMEKSRPNAAELARAVLYGELPPEQAASIAPMVNNASDAPAKKWTDTKLAEVKAYREKHGTKKTAEHYQVSEQLIRRKLPGEKPKSKGYSAFSHRQK